MALWHSLSQAIQLLIACHLYYTNIMIQHHIIFEKKKKMNWWLAKASGTGKASYLSIVLCFSISSPF